MAYPVTMTTHVPRAAHDEPVDGNRGRAETPANAPASNHSDEVTLVHPAVTEADRENGSACRAEASQHTAGRATR